MTFEVRPYRNGDDEFLHEAAVESYPDVGPWLPWCHANYSRTEAKEWVEFQLLNWRDRREFQFVIEDERRRYVGGCGVNRIDSEHRFANLGYWVRSSRTGEGAATEATRLVAAWTFANTKLERLEILVATGNEASRRVAEKADARYEGTLQSRLCIAGTQYDALLYSLARGDV